MKVGTARGFAATDTSLRNAGQTGLLGPLRYDNSNEKKRCTLYPPTMNTSSNGRPQ
jgi:hypothetical protein